MNLSVEQYNIMNKTKPKLLHSQFSNFGSKSVFLLLLTCMQSVYHQIGFWENLFFGSPEKLRKCSYYYSSQAANWGFQQNRDFSEALMTIDVLGLINKNSIQIQNRDNSSDSFHTKFLNKMYFYIFITFWILWKNNNE
jgi:hypothetical protein